MLCCSPSSIPLGSWIPLICGCYSQDCCFLSYPQQVFCSWIAQASTDGIRIGHTPYISKTTLHQKVDVQCLIILYLLFELWSTLQYLACCEDSKLENSISAALLPVLCREAKWLFCFLVLSTMYMKIALGSFTAVLCKKVILRWLATMTPKSSYESLLSRTKCHQGLITAIHPSLWLISHLLKYWSFCLADIEAFQVR